MSCRLPECFPTSYEQNLEDFTNLADYSDPTCGTLGRPSEDKNLRLYNQEECDTLEGLFKPNGECLKEDGGNWSSDCRDLNNSLNFNKSLTNKPQILSEQQSEQQFEPMPVESSSQHTNASPVVVSDNLISGVSEKSSISLVAQEVPSKVRLVSKPGPTMFQLIPGVSNNIVLGIAILFIAGFIYLKTNKR
jgi:hypothetical protein